VTGAAGTTGSPQGWRQCLWFHRGYGGQEYGVPVGMESTTHGDTALCVSKSAAALAHPFYGANVSLKQL